MRRVAVHARMPEQRHGKRLQAQRQVEALQAGTQVSGVAFGHGGDQVAAARHRQGLREVGHRDGDVSAQAQDCHGIVNRAWAAPSSRNGDMPGRGIARRGQLAPAEPMALAHDADEAIPKQRLRAQLRPGRAADHAGLQIHAAIAQRRAPSTGVIASLALATLLPSLAISSANVALPTLAVALGATQASVQWVVLAYLLATTTLIVGAGRLGDLLGRRNVLLAGIALFTLASALCALAPGLPLLIAARALQGAGAAAMMALTLALVGAAVPKARAGSALGLLGSMSAVGTALGPSLGGLLIAAFGWPAVFAVNLPLGLLALALAWRHLPADREPGVAGGFDLPGMLWLAATLAAYALAMTRHLGLLAVAALALLLFLRTESRAAAPLLRLQHLRDAGLGRALAMNAIVSAVMMATLVIGPFHLGAALGLGVAAVGAWMSIGPVASALSGLPSGCSVDRFGARRMTQLGLAAMAAGSALIAVLPASAGVIGYVGPLLLVTPGYAHFQAANNTATLAGVSAGHRGVTSALLSLSRNVGLITGASAMAAVFAAGGLRLSFAVATAGVLAALAMACMPANENHS